MNRLFSFYSNYEITNFNPISICYIVAGYISGTAPDLSCARVCMYTYGDNPRK
jgi:hypothetical protein